MTDSQQPENEKGLQQLAWAIESSVGQFKLILARCNYASLRDRLIQKLREICQVEIRVLAVQQSRKTLYTAIQSEFGEEIPACVMVVGLESVQNLSVMLTSANQVREEFRKNFAFPLVLWIDDEIYKQLIQLAPDLESWATTRNFAISTQELVDFIIETANQWFSNNLKFSVDIYIKLETELETAQRDLLNQPDVYNLEIQADLESLLGFIKQINNPKYLALQHYHKALELWQESNNLERQAIILGEIGVGYYLKAFKNPDINHPDWQAAWYYIQEYINFINLFQSPDLIANAVVKFGDILRDLQKWETLQSLSEQALVIHQTNNQLRELAKDYGFLAEVALAQNNWVKANQLVQQALEVFAAIPNLESANISGVLSEIPERVLKSKDLSLYQFILGRSQYHLGQIPEATLSLETARDVGNPLEDVRLYLHILSFLQRLYFEQKEYLQAYKIKQQRRSIEQQFGLRAFIGAGRLEATKQAFVETLRSNSPQGNIAPEIAASGRLLDVERLMERMGRPDYKLIVIHGQSGVGKSSLVNAGLVPALKNKTIGTQDYLPVVMRVYTNWVEELGRLLGNGGDEEELKLQVSTSEAQRSTFELGTSTSEAQHSTSELGTSTFELGTSTSEVQRSASEPQRSTSELGTSTSEAQRSASEPQRSTSELETLQYSSAIQSEPHPVFADANTPLSLARRGVGGEVREPQYLVSRLKENEQRNLRTVLIFDQFEEFFFVYTEPAQRKQFFEFLGECLNVLSVKVILSLRVDYIHYLLECNDLSSLKIIGNDKTVILWDLDFDNLLHSSCNLLNNYFIAHPEVLEELQLCQTPSQKALGATVLVIQGEKLARNDDINGAVEKFSQAQQWDNKLKFDSQARAKEFVNKGKAERSVDEGNSRLEEKKFKEALADYTEALKLDPKVEIPANYWNELCRQGSLQKQAADVLAACEQAVAFAPEDGNIRDSRGLARALTGNYQGAIEDFEAYIAQTDDKNSKAQRQRWVKDLRAGKNPFTDAEIKKLQN